MTPCGFTQGGPAVPGVNNKISPLAALGRDDGVTRRRMGIGDMDKLLSLSACDLWEVQVCEFAV